VWFGALSWSSSRKCSSSLDGRRDGLGSVEADASNRTRGPPSNHNYWLVSPYAGSSLSRLWRLYLLPLLRLPLAHCMRTGSSTWSTTRATPLQVLYSATTALGVSCTAFAALGNVPLASFEAPLNVAVPGATRVTVSGPGPEPSCVWSVWPWRRDSSG